MAVLEYVIDGAGWVECNGQLRRVEKDTIYFLPQGMDQSYYADKDKPYTKIFMNISGSLCSSLTEAYGLAGRFIFPGSGLKPIFERIPELLKKDSSLEATQAALQGIFVEILCRISATSESHSIEAVRMKNYLDANIRRIVTAEELSRQIYRSADYCRKLFVREFGVTVYGYQLNTKMTIAKSLLADTSMSVGEIAESLGYSDAHYFSNLFLQKCGCRPLAYRKKAGNNSNP